MKNEATKKDSYYFSHDSNARNDIKLLRLRRDHGPAGYGLYFMLIEVLRDQQDHKLTLSTIADIAFEFHTEEDLLTKIIKNYDLFKIEDEVFFSPRLCRSMEQYNQKKFKHIEAGRKGGQASVKQRSSDPQPLKERKGKEIKENNKIPNIVFKTFWDMYDKKRGLKGLEKKWNSFTDETRQKIMDYIPEYKKAYPEQFRQNPSTFFHKESWNDELPSSNNGKTISTSSDSLTAQEIRERRDKKTLADCLTN
jgi:Domain of unknown function (DUF4373)